ncbi:MAG: FKBP-type peptidyl-prolyl cis-trans isomerase [Bacteroidia bacterium]|nr:FKBP-type peptidyl-prolyl cis-trans isomerase [Bacteroidia bacterium]
MNRIKLLALLFVIVSIFSGSGCKPKYRQQEHQLKTSFPDQESIYRSNQLMIKENAKSIRDKAAIKEWNLTETGTGVFYQVFGFLKGDQSNKIEPGDRVSLTFKLTLLDGTECYSSEDQGLKQFVVEKSEAESGLHEAIQYLHPGDSALIIIPPHRAFGLIGDGKRIPPGAILVYEIRIDSVVRHQTN